MSMPMPMMSMNLVGRMLMKPLVHQARCEAAISQGMPTSVQEIEAEEGWFKLKKRKRERKRKRKRKIKIRIHLMMQRPLIVRRVMLPMVPVMVEKT
jgi:hypothetical protein